MSPKTGRKTATTQQKRQNGKTPARKTANSTRPEGKAESPPDTSDTLKRRDLIEAVANRSALPRSDLRAAVDLVLEEIGRALDDGRDLALPPLGKLKLQRRKTVEGADVLTLRLRRKHGTSNGSES